MRFLKQSTAVTVVIGPLVDYADGKTRLTDNDDFTPSTDLQCELVKGSTSSTLTLSKSGGDNDINLTGKGLATLELTATDTNTLGHLRVALSDKDIGGYPSETILPIVEDFMVMPSNVYNSMFGTDVLSVNNGDAVIPAGSQGDYAKGETVYFLWRTNKVPTVNGSLKIYRDNNDAEVTIPTGITDTRDFDSQTNVNLCAISLAANSFYQEKADYSVVLSGATINGETVNAVIATFSIQNRFMLPTFTRDG